MAVRMAYNKREHCGAEDQRMRWWVWVVLAVVAVVGLVFWWLSEQGRALEPDNYNFG